MQTHTMLEKTRVDAAKSGVVRSGTSKAFRGRAVENGANVLETGRRCLLVEHLHRRQRARQHLYVPGGYHSDDPERSRSRGMGDLGPRP